MPMTVPKAGQGKRKPRGAKAEAKKMLKHPPSQQARPSARMQARRHKQASPMQALPPMPRRNNGQLGQLPMPGARNLAADAGP
eukprot:14569250-Alexandrium_andersonii.AAC.1